ncbi:MAG TPA: histidine phosphatase family protein [Pirellulales bacterium]|nr:histidine phosphatase family protein [Pirellulales bacterium]
MSDQLPQFFLCRHGETTWSASGQHTGLTDLPLTDRGRENAKALGARLQGQAFAHVFCSPLRRARETCDLAGFGDRAELDADLVEWNYGDYEGKTTAEIRAGDPDWNVFRNGAPGGESVAAVRERADRVVARLRSIDADSLLFSSAHFLRMLAARWLAQPAQFGQCLWLGTASLSIVGYDHDRTEPVIRLWNCAAHLR